MTTSSGLSRAGASIATCAGVEPEVFAYVDGELAPAAAADVTIHLARCARCRGRVRAAERFVARVRGSARHAAYAPLTLRARVGAMVRHWSSARRPHAE